MISAAHSFSYIDCDIPEDMTLDMWRRRHAVAPNGRHAGRLQRLRRRTAGTSQQRGPGAPQHELSPV